MHITAHQRVIPYIVALIAMLSVMGGWSFAATSTAMQGRVPVPVINIEEGSGPCIAPPDEMRRTHMQMLLHQRDKTVRDGERGAPVSLNGCVECHASSRTGSVAGDSQDFCVSCHSYAAVRIDCFDCHQPVATGRSATAALGIQR